MSESQMAMIYADEMKNRAIDRVETAHNAWVQLGVDTLRTLLTTLPELTTDDLWPLMPPVSEPRAMGAVMRRAQREGLVRPISWRPCRRSGVHGHFVRVWAKVL